MTRVNDPSVFVTCGVPTQEILILREDDSVVCQGKRDVVGISSRNQVSVGSGRDFKAAQSQTMSDRVIDILIKMKPYHGLFPWRLVCVRGDQDRWPL